ncbi:MAG: zf-TFIIB domain-containing protein, partial [Anaerolineae bacterium]|nr:zf-TFIIB domain-containing protein [Anaerolineae bacterium]
MKMCPVCHVALSQMLLEKKLPAYRCPRCEGIWIASNEYLAWLRS